MTLLPMEGLYVIGTNLRIPYSVKFYVTMVMNTHPGVMTMRAVVQGQDLNGRSQGLIYPFRDVYVSSLCNDWLWSIL